MKVTAEFDFNTKNARDILTLAGWNIEGKSDEELVPIVFERIAPYAMKVTKYSIENSKNARNRLGRENNMCVAITDPALLDNIIEKTWREHTYADADKLTADDVQMPKELKDEIRFRCDSLETDDITRNIIACLDYVKDNGIRAFIEEMDDCNIWRYIG